MDGDGSNGLNDVDATRPTRLVGLIVVMLLLYCSALDGFLEQEKQACDTTTMKLTTMGQFGVDRLTVVQPTLYTKCPFRVYLPSLDMHM